jgi:phosphatidylserine/phosphatidylglycerophosphate/cardiolipin synthase-like enzyme
MIRSLFAHSSGLSTDTEGKPQFTPLRDVEHGGDPTQPAAISKLITGFVDAAQHSLHICIYDFRLSDDLGKAFINALIAKARARVEVKIAYDHTKPNTRTGEAFAPLGADAAPKGTDDFVTTRFAHTAVQTRPVLTIPDAFAGTEVTDEPIEGSHLMHNKYIVRDVDTPSASVLTGSTNFTDDAWTYQENNIVIVSSPALAAYYETDFQELWVSGNIASTGVNDAGSVQLDQAELEVAFAPGEGPTIDGHLASLISSARHRIKVCSMVLSSQKILGALSDAIHNKQVEEFTGIYDATQMDNVVRMWHRYGNTAAVTLFNDVASHLAFKRSVPYSPTGKHNFMHDKVLVCDDFVATGSFNLSSNATKNAENSLIISDKALADDYAEYIDALVNQYKHQQG